MKLPVQLLNSLQTCAGFDEKAFVAVHESEQRITSVRTNPFKPVEPDIKPGEPVPWCSGGYYLDERPSFTFDPLFHAGCYYVQEAGSMFIEHALKSSVDLNSELAILDLCAAPGGKSTLIDSLINSKSFLISNEVIKNRSEILIQNLNKWGTNNTAVINNDPSVFSKYKDVFDVIVTDVPCSGSGLFRKQESAVKEWSPDNVNLCSSRQKRILGEILNSLKPGGVLIYSTCSYSKEENEDIVQWLMDEFGMLFHKLPIEKNWGIVDSGLGYRFYPYLTQSEGFFCAVLKKPEAEDQHFSHRSKRSSLEKASGKELQTISSYVHTDEDTAVYKFREEFKLVNNTLMRFFDEHGKDLYIKKLGTTIGTFKHNDFLPEHELALSIHLDPTINRFELTREQAIAFLKKDSIRIEAQKGICLMSYKGQGIGWAKVLDNRINNYLPKNFRILSQEEI